MKAGIIRRRRSLCLEYVLLFSVVTCLPIVAQETIDAVEQESAVSGASSDETDAPVAPELDTPPVQGDVIGESIEPSASDAPPVDLAPPDTVPEPDIFSDPFSVSDQVSPAEGVSVQAQEPAADADIIATDNFDSLFEKNDMIGDSNQTTTEGDPHTDLLVSKGVEWGGMLRGSLEADWTWTTVWTDAFALSDPTSQLLTPGIGADLFFDSRPVPEFRVFGKLKVATTTNGIIEVTGLTLTPDSINTSFLPAGWTAEVNENGDVEIRDSNGILILTIPGSGGVPTVGGSDTGVSPGLNLNVSELFSDYVYKDKIFFRFGKHTIHWGTGYFFSPADVLNLTSINPEDPTVDLEGPVSLRTQLPFGVTGNAYLYLIANDQMEPLDIVIAPKVEFAVGKGELGAGAYYQRSLSPRLVTLYSFSLGDVDFFGEGVLLYGSDRVFVRPSRDQSAAEANADDGLDLVLDTYKNDNALFAQATAGVRYLKTWENKVSLLAVAQYFFNGEGYADAADGIFPAAYRLLLFPAENGLALDPAEQPDDYQAPPGLTFADLFYWGRHYFAGMISATDLFGTNLGISLFGMVNLSDLSGIVAPTLSYSFLDRFSVSLATRFTFGDGNDELTDPTALLRGAVPAPTLGLTLSVTMPGGRF